MTHYLCKRFQYVCVNGSKSKKLLVTSGVPQGSVLGPILFIIYINVITHPTLFDGSMTPFADHIMIFRPIQTPEDLALLQSDIDSLTSWTEQNFLQFNADKCKYMVISRKRQTNLSLESQPAPTPNKWCHHCMRKTGGAFHLGYHLSRNTRKVRNSQMGRGMKWEDGEREKERVEEKGRER